MARTHEIYSITRAEQLGQPTWELTWGCGGKKPAAAAVAGAAAAFSC